MHLSARLRPSLGAATGLALGLLALGPGLRRGFLLSYDMVFVPREPFTAAMFGLSGGPPRAVPSDFVVAVASRLLPADIVQKLVLLLIFVLACAGMAALLEETRPDRVPVLARLAAVVFYGWNPYVAERLIILGFFNEVIERTPIAGLRPRLRDAVAAKLGQP